MSTTSTRFFDELAKMMTNAAGAAQGIRGELDTVFRNQAERVLNELEVVQREEFDAVRDMAAKAREENEALKAQILRYYFVEHWRVGTIARQLGVHHSTVERVLSHAGVEREQQRPRRASILDAYLPFIHATLEQFPTLTAARLQGVEI